MDNLRTYFREKIRSALHKAVDEFVDLLFGEDDDINPMKPERTQ